MADEIVYKKMTRKADKGLEGKVIARHGNVNVVIPRNDTLMANSPQAGACDQKPPQIEFVADVNERTKKSSLDLLDLL